MTPMNSKFDPKFRAAGYLLGAGFAVAAIIWAESEMWSGVNHLRQRADTVSSDSFHLSDQLEVKMRELNDDVSLYSFQAPPERKAAIEKESEALRQWLAAHRNAPTAPPQRDLLAKAETLYARYAAHAGLALQTKAVPLALEAWREQKEKLLSEMISLAGELSQAEKSSLSEFMGQTQQSMDLLHRKLIVSSLVLLSMGAALGYLAYLGIVAPLRSRLRQSQRVIERQEKLSSLGVLAAGVAHEIRNPLTSIKARLFTQHSLLEEKSEALEDNVFITEEISRLEKIVSDFLAFARPSQPQTVTLRATQPFRDLEALFRPALTKAGIELKKEFLADPNIQADPAQLKQVLINLVQNAAESIGRDGVITLRTLVEKRHQLRRQATFAVLEVVDTGKGISLEAQKRLFDPFFTTKASGTGLGLSIAARILEKHGGTLEYQTEVNRGTTFRLILPVMTSMA